MTRRWRRCLCSLRLLFLSLLRISADADAVVFVVGVVVISKVTRELAEMKTGT
jgi:hypothetical protein